MIFYALAHASGSAVVAVTDSSEVEWSTAFTFPDDGDADGCTYLMVTTSPPVDERWCKDGRVEDWNAKKQAWVPWGSQGRAYGPPKELKP
jgi:hypothetical protein